MRRHLVVFVVLLQLAALLPFGLLSASPGSPRSAAAAPLPMHPFTSTWARTDQPVRDGAAVRTWMWGPQANTYGITEPYAEAVGGRRAVQYFDKSRMEITNINGDPSSPWYVTNGLLVVEMMTGQMQLGDNAFEGHDPSVVYVAGDMDAATGITYAALADLRDAPAAPFGQTLTAVLTPTSDTTATVSSNPAYAGYGVTAAHVVDVPGLQHSVASVFWTFMHSSGTVWQNDGYATAPLFENPFYATGLPITEAYWTLAEVGGNPRLVLLQCFERRCLTYTPDNPSEWQVEAGNVGLHYKSWRYGDGPLFQDGPSAEANAIAAEILAATNANERFYPLVHLADMLGLAVMDGSDGSLATNGRIRGDGDFYVYTSELRLLAEAHDRHEMVDLSQLGTDLGSLLFGNVDADLNPEFVRDLMHGAALHAHAHPDDHATMPLLVVRQLGLAAPIPFDLFSPDPLPIEALRFDPVQQWLLLTDLLLPLLDASLPLADTFAPDDTCATPWSDDATVQIGSLGHALHDAIGGTLDIDPAYVLSGFHALMLGKALHITPNAPVVNGTSGDLLTFGVHVEMASDLHASEFHCGWLRADDLPSTGPLVDTTVHWLAFNLIGTNGTLECPVGCVPNPEAPIVLTATDGSGHTTLPVRLHNGGSAHGVVLAGVALGLPIHDANGHLPGIFPVRWVPIAWHAAP